MELQDCGIAGLPEGLREGRPTPAPRLGALAVCLALLGGAVSAAPPDRYPASGGDIEITPFLHASVQVEHAGKVIHVDPWSLADLSRAKPADLILITDDPGHHLDVKAIERLRKPGAPVVITGKGKDRVPDGMVLANGQSATLAGIRVESIASYDLTPGEPVHPRGEANGYLITLGGRRLYFAGVTECVPEMRALKNVDVAFMPMNIPPARMAPSATAECVKALKPKVVYVNHYDNASANRLTNPKSEARSVYGGLTVAQTLNAFKDALKNEAVEVRLPDWYATSAPR